MKEPFEALRDELREMSRWYGDHPEVTAYVGLSSTGEWFGGSHVGGEMMDEIEVSLYRNGNAEDVAIELVRQLRAYRKRTDEERAEDERHG